MPEVTFLLNTRCSVRKHDALDIERSAPYESALEYREYRFDDTVRSSSDIAGCTRALLAIEISGKSAMLHACFIFRVV